MHAQKMFHQQGNVLATITQSGHYDRHHVQAVEQVFTERSLLDFLQQILIRCSQHPHVDLDQLGPANPRKLLLLESPQYFGLRAQAHVCDFIQK